MYMCFVVFCPICAYIHTHIHAYTYIYIYVYNALGSVGSSNGWLVWKTQRPRTCKTTWLCYFSETRSLFVNQITVCCVASSLCLRNTTTLLYETMSLRFANKRLCLFNRTNRWNNDVVSLSCVYHVFCVVCPSHVFVVCWWRVSSCVYRAVVCLSCTFDVCLSCDYVVRLPCVFHTCLSCVLSCVYHVCLLCVLSCAFCCVYIMRLCRVFIVRVRRVFIMYFWYVCIMWFVMCRSCILSYVYRVFVVCLYCVLVSRVCHVCVCVGCSSCVFVGGIMCLLCVYHVLLSCVIMSFLLCAYHVLCYVYVIRFVACLSRVSVVRVCICRVFIMRFVVCVSCVL